MIDPSLVNQIEGHITMGTVLSVAAVAGKWWLKERKVYDRVKSRLNDLWWTRCAQRQEGYIPVENGVQAIVPPPHQGD